MDQQDRKSVQVVFDNYMLQYSLGTGACRTSSLNLDSGFKFFAHLTSEIM